jgi:hypothetical protein
MCRWANVFRSFGPNPVIRIGGASTEFYSSLNWTRYQGTIVKKKQCDGTIANITWPLPTKVWSAEDAVNDDPTWDAMVRLREAVGAKYIINIPTNYNLWRTAGAAIMDKARSVLGPALVGFELGNEPNSCECQSNAPWYPSCMCQRTVKFCVHVYCKHIILCHVALEETMQH